MGIKEWLSNIFGEKPKPIQRVNSVAKHQGLASASNYDVEKSEEFIDSLENFRESQERGLAVLNVDLGRLGKTIADDKAAIKEAKEGQKLSEDGYEEYTARMTNVSVGSPTPNTNDTIGTAEATVASRQSRLKENYMNIANTFAAARETFISVTTEGEENIKAMTEDHRCLVEARLTTEEGLKRTNAIIQAVKSQLPETEEETED